jgi:hypothetical protein
MMVMGEGVLFGLQAEHRAGLSAFFLRLGVGAGAFPVDLIAGAVKAYPEEA